MISDILEKAMPVFAEESVPLPFFKKCLKHYPQKTFDKSVLPFIEHDVKYINALMMERKRKIDHAVFRDELKAIYLISLNRRFCHPCFYWAQDQLNNEKVKVTKGMISRSEKRDPILHECFVNFYQERR